MLPIPDDAKNLAVDIIASEFHSLLENLEVGNVADINTIGAWLKMKKSGNAYSLNGSWGDVELEWKEICECQRIGIEEFDWEPYLSNSKQKKLKSNVHKTLTQTFCNDEDDFQESDYKFAVLTSIKNLYSGSQSPILTLGTILKKLPIDHSDDSDRFWLCIQPRCDCVRIEENRNFFFLPLDKVEEDDKFDLVVKLDDGDYEKLKINQKIYDSNHFQFSSNCADDQVVRAEREGSDYIFEATDESRFKWISELKNQHAQRIVNNFAANISRVGLDESEWLRRV